MRPHSQVFHPRGWGGIQVPRSLVHPKGGEPGTLYHIYNVKGRQEAYSHDLIVRGESSKRESNEAGGGAWE